VNYSFKHLKRLLLNSSNVINAVTTFLCHYIKINGHYQIKQHLKKDKTKL